MGLFAAVEEPDAYGGIQIKSCLFKDEFVWFIRVTEKVVGGSNIIQNCPWCGSPLPDEPYTKHLPREGG
ncbi:MAG: hypothetical protein CMP47_13760 [Rickettsiales bacterium]|nr:hypothetical protein [Rickettsiales bacterium]